MGYMSRPIAFIARMGETATLRSRNLGVRDAETGWPAVTYTNSTINVMVKRLEEVVRDTPAGRVIETRARLYTGSIIQMRDLIIYDSETWEVEDVQFRHILLSATGYYDVTMIKQEL